MAINHAPIQSGCTAEKEPGDSHRAIEVIDPTAPKGHKEIAQGKAKRRPGDAAGTSLLHFKKLESALGKRQCLACSAVCAGTELSKRLEDMDSRSNPIYLRPGELLLFDNYRVLHRRKSFDPGAWDDARWLRRCFGTTDPSGGQFVDRLHRPYVWQ